MMGTSAAAVFRQRLEDGEIVILAVRPSKWFVVHLSWPLLVGVAIVAAAGLAGGRWFGQQVDGRMITLACAAVAAIRVVVACLQWLGRLYILTDRRVMRIKGMFHEDCYQCPLKKIGRIDMSDSAPQRLVGVADLLFHRTDGKAVPDSNWICLAEPQEVRQAVEEARKRAG